MDSSHYLQDYYEHYDEDGRLVSRHMPQRADEMTDEVYALYLKYHLANCERWRWSATLHHTLDIFRKD